MWATFPSTSHQHLCVTSLLQYTSPTTLRIGAIAITCYLEHPSLKLGRPRLDTETVRKRSRLRLQDVVSSRRRAGYLGLGRDIQYKDDQATPPTKWGCSSFTVVYLSSKKNGASLRLRWLWFLWLLWSFSCHVVSRLSPGWARWPAPSRLFSFLLLAGLRVGVL